MDWHEHFDPEKKQELIEAAPAAHQPAPEHAEYNTEVDTNGFSENRRRRRLPDGRWPAFSRRQPGVSAHLGSHLGGFAYSNGLRFSMGLTLRLGP